MGSRWVSYRIPDVTCNPFSSQRSRERINNDTINLVHFPSRSVPFRCRFVGFAPAGGKRGAREGERGSTKQLKSGIRLKRACYDRARTFIIFLPDPRKRPAKFPRHPCRTPWSTALRELSLFPASNRASLVEKFHCFCFLIASPAAINRPGRFSSTLPTETERSANRAKLAIRYISFFVEYGNKYRSRWRTIKLPASRDKNILE